MTQKTYYVDACIWLNLFKKEGDETKGVPYWKLAKDFIEGENNIIVSTIVIKELSFKIEEKLNYVMTFFKDNITIKMIKTVPEDYDLARKFEDEEEFKISFYDYLHVAISKRLSIPLITRDKDLIAFAKKHIEVYRPEELIN
ncbi:PIN domain-containing protein [Candidatus Woesearchaeota archaeon]|jgi:predicted nucleic acid-binding protein|nr:PIN domain-containing protein [Candidatus Woesearchaeota archaeon]MBT4783701.1 PIN domain-containing protein [Candidatus Woesearchaeota archaeon]MBT5111500.1 PIN domain-containing protein [Candidatus Woesearchaeota archaeon]MBT5215108.1 PIN domain-containing protein [Candidatus Woesearchaeota archaeon]